MFGKQDDQPSQEVADDALDKPVDDTPATGDSGSEQPADQTASQPTDPVTDPPADQPTEPEADESATPAAEPESDSSDSSEPAKTPDTETGGQPTGNNNDSAWQHPGTPLGDEKKNEENEQISDIISPAGGYPKRTSYQYVTAGAGSNGGSVSSSDDTVNHELIDIKHQAIGELSPLVDRLDLPPEEKFQAIMMVLQDSDDQDLVKAAYEAAHSIEDEKTRGLALLSIVNEINYFTQQPAKPDEQSPLG